MKWLPIALLICVAAIASKIPLDATEAHRRADAILYPRLITALNEFALDHGGINDPGHLDKVNIKDPENIQAIREAFKTWDQAMKQAGF